MHIRDEMAEKVQELEEELSMALSELKKAKDNNKLMNEVSEEFSTFLSMHNDIYVLFMD